MTVFQVGLYVLGTCALGALAVYAWLVYRGDSTTLFRTADTRLISNGHKVFLALAAAGFFTCGVLAMLAWLPERVLLGHDDESASLAATVTFLIGGLLAFALDRRTHEVVFRFELSERVGYLEDLLQASLSDERLESIKVELAKAASKLKVDGPREERSGHLPQGRRLEQYRELTSLADQQLNRLRNNAAQKALDRHLR